MSIENDIRINLGHIAQALENANILKAIEMYKEIDPDYLEKDEVKNFLRRMAFISKT